MTDTTAHPGCPNKTDGICGKAGPCYYPHCEPKRTTAPTGAIEAKADRELLELAAKAFDLPRPEDADYWHVGPGEMSKEGWGVVTFFGKGHAAFWNPLTDDGDALRLAVKLHLDIYHYVGAMSGGDPPTVQAVTHDGRNDEADCLERHDGDPCAATRRCIVRAAAAIGRSL